MKYINLAIYFIVGILAYLFIAQWIFNHIDAWAGIAFYFLGAIIIGKLIIKSINQKQK